MNKNLEFKSFSFKVDGVDEKGVVRGYASTFGNIDLGLDVVDKGAFKASLKATGGKWKILKDHDPRKLIGFNMRGEEDDSGLYVEGKLNLDVQDARESYSNAKMAMEMGHTVGLSIGYMTIKAEPDKKNPNIRHLKELKLFEYSLVTFPMNEEAMLTGIKGLVGVDRAKYLIQQLKAQGVAENDLVEALKQVEPPAPDADPQKLLQSMDALIKSMRA